jgi:hypothetical protein
MFLPEIVQTKKTSPQIIIDLMNVGHNTKKMFVGMGFPTYRGVVNWVHWETKHPSA